jgi:hypothetical protein
MRNPNPKRTSLTHKGQKSGSPRESVSGGEHELLYAFSQSPTGSLGQFERSLIGTMEQNSGGSNRIAAVGQLLQPA